MKNTQIRFISFCFTMFCLAWGLAIPALAGQKITINDDVSHTVHGNGLDSEGTPPTPPTAPRDPSNNEVIINANVNSNPMGSSSVYGAFDSENGGPATGNKVTVNSGNTVTGSVYGAYTSSNSAASDASRNSVIISGTVNGTVYGGQAYTSGAAAGTATGNSVTIDGGTVLGDVYGGYADSRDPDLAKATNNTVTISGNTRFGAGSRLYGGYSNTAGADVFTGNTLNLHSQISVNELGGFEFLNFYLPSTLAAGDTMLTISINNVQTDLSDSTVNVGIDGGSSPLAVNDEITLIDASAGPALLGPDNSTANGQGMQGVTLRYEFALSVENKLLKAIVTRIGLNEQVKALSEAFLAGLVLVNQGADLVAGPGMSQALAAADSDSGFGAFGAMAVGQSRYDTGSHIDMSSLSLLTGFARGLETAPGRLTLGAFFEYGNGNYDTYNSFPTEASVRGDGDADRFGGGVLGRLDFNNTDSGHAYVEASGRVGQVENDYRNGDMRDVAGRPTGFDSSSAYYGLHLGAGYLWDLNESSTLDLYAKYFWSSLEGDTVTLSSKDRVEFEDADSQRLRLGGRLAFNQPEGITPYVGLAWEHEFDGEARGTTYGYSIDPPSLKGDTGIGEIGLNIKPSADRPLSFDLGLSGFVGQRQGMMGTLSIKYDF